MERYFDFFSTSVAVGGYTAGSGVLNVGATTGISLNSGDTCRLLVYRVITGVLTPIVLLVASAVNSGTQFAVTAEGTDANALATDVVINVLSAGGMNQIRSDISRIGSFANLPSTTNQVAGARYKCTDTPYEFIFDGTLWQPFWGGFNVTLPIPANFAWQSQGSATLVTTFGTMRLYRATESPFNIHAQVMAAPATPYHVIAGIRLSGGQGITGNVNAGFCVSDGTKYEWISLPNTVGSQTFVVWYATNNTTFSNFFVNAAFPMPFSYPPDMYLRIGDDGSTNKTFDVGYSPTGPWFNAYSEGRATNLTISQIGILVNGGASAVELFHLSVTS
jgi:hypothetical protein